MKMTSPKYFSGITIAKTTIIITNILLAGFTLYFFIKIEFSLDQTISFFSTIATITASLFGLITASYIFARSKVDDNFFGGKWLFTAFILIAVIGSITISLSIVSMLLDGNPSFRWVYVISILTFYSELSLIFYNVVRMLQLK